MNASVQVAHLNALVNQNREDPDPQEEEMISTMTLVIFWAGTLVTATPDPYFGPQIGSFDKREIGLRSDGVVVWRKKEEAKP